MKYKLFISDYDGTLGGWDGVDHETVSAIREYEKKGGKFVVCTGRMFDNIKAFCDRYDIADTVASYQGARINERKSGKELFTEIIPKNLAIEVLRFLKDLPVQPVILGADALYYEKESQYIDFYTKANVVKLTQVNDLAQAVLDNRVEAFKINVSCEGVKPADFVKEYGAKFTDRLILNSGSEFIAEFVNPVASKGAAVRFLSKYYNVGYDEILAVGDSSNDMELLRGAWHGVAVGDGNEELKKTADEVTVPFAEKPVKYLLEKYCL